GPGLARGAGRGERAARDAGGHRAVARRAAAQSMVLLKNEGVLPLRDAPGLTVAVIGEFARTPRFQGAGSSQVNPTRVDIPLDELAAALPSATLRFAAGYGTGDDPVGPGLADEAVSAATGAGVILAFLGLPPAEESEGFDRAHLDLPAAQTGLLARLAGAVPATPIVAVLCNGGAVRTSTWDHGTAAV